jgi:hypothetical protein
VALGLNSELVETILDTPTFLEHIEQIPSLLSFLYQAVASQVIKMAPKQKIIIDTDPGTFSKAIHKTPN